MVDSGSMVGGWRPCLTGVRFHGMFVVLIVYGCGLLLLLPLLVKTSKSNFLLVNIIT